MQTLIVCAVLAYIIFQGTRIMATQADHAARLRALALQNEKAAAEQAKALQDVRDALEAAGGTTAEVDEALDALATSIQREDDLVPDAPVDTGEQPEQPAEPVPGEPVPDTGATPAADDTLRRRGA